MMEFRGRDEEGWMWDMYKSDGDWQRERKW
jgi:hypothetical protein